MFRFAAAAGGLILAATAAVFVIAQRGVAPGRLRGTDRPKVGERFDDFGTTWQVTKVRRDGTVVMAQPVADAFGKIALISEREFKPYALAHMRKKGLGGARLRGASRQITTADALKKRLAIARRGFKAMAAVDSRVAVDEIFRKLRVRLDELTYASQGFFPEAEALNDAALRDLLAARDQAYVDVVADRERRIADLNREIRETNRRRPR